MKVWDTYLPTGMDVFLMERGVDMPRAFSLYLRAENCVNDRKKRTFAEFLKQEYPVDMVAWRILGGK